MDLVKRLAHSHPVVPGRPAEPPRATKGWAGTSEPFHWGGKRPRILTIGRHCPFMTASFRERPARWTGQPVGLQGGRPKQSCADKMHRKERTGALWARRFIQPM